MHRTNWMNGSFYADGPNPYSARFQQKSAQRCPWHLLLGSVICSMLLSLLTTPVFAQAQPQPGAPVEGLVIQLNTTQLRKMSTGKKIKEVRNEDDNVVSVAAVDAFTIIIQGRALGSSVLTMIDVDGKQDVFRVLVTPYDIRVLREKLTLIVPSASIEPIPLGPNALALTGTVDRAEDLTAAVQTTQAVVGGNVAVINHVRVGGVQQVQLDVVVATVSRSELRAFGFNFLNSTQNTILGSTVGQVVVNPLTVGRSATGGGMGGVLDRLGNVSAVPGTPNGNPTNLFAGVLNDGSAFLAFMQALRNEGLLKLLAKPRLVTQSGRLASFLSGGEQAIPVPAGLGQVGVQFEEFGTRLNFVPVVLGNGRIHLEVEPEVSALDPASGTNIQGTVVPGRATQRVRTTVEMETGQTFVIGGLIQRTVNANTSKTPFLGDLPFIGAAFSTKSFNEVETEVVIMVTPYLVDPMDCGQLPKYLPGQETRSPDDFELFFEQILEAPRGQREVFPGGRYVPAHKSGSTSGQFPCGVGHHPNHWQGLNLKGLRLRGKHCGSCGSNGCAQCGTAPVAVPQAAGTHAAPLMAPASSATSGISIKDVKAKPVDDPTLPPPTLKRLPGPTGN